MFAMAPGATILAVGARSCTDPDLLQAITTVVDGQQADIVSNSYGFQGELLPEASVRATLRVHAQAAIQGIGFVYSTGDDGDWSNDASFTGPLLRSASRPPRPWPPPWVAPAWD